MAGRGLVVWGLYSCTCWLPWCPICLRVFQSNIWLQRLNSVTTTAMATFVAHWTLRSLWGQTRTHHTIPSLRWQWISLNLSPPRKLMVWCFLLDWPYTDILLSTSETVRKRLSFLILGFIQEWRHHRNAWTSGLLIPEVSWHLGTWAEGGTCGPRPAWAWAWAGLLPWTRWSYRPAPPAVWRAPTSGASPWSAARAPLGPPA